MTEVKITIEEVGERVNVRIEGHGKGCNMREVRAAQEVVKMMEDWCKKRPLEVIVPRTETIKPYKEDDYGTQSIIE